MRILDKWTVVDFIEKNTIPSYRLVSDMGEMNVRVLPRQVEVNTSIPEEDMRVLINESRGLLENLLRAVRKDGERLNDPRVIARALGVFE